MPRGGRAGGGSRGRGDRGPGPGRAGGPGGRGGGPGQPDTSGEFGAGMGEGGEGTRTTQSRPFGIDPSGMTIDAYAYAVQSRARDIASKREKTERDIRAQQQQSIGPFKVDPLGFVGGLLGGMLGIPAPAIGAAIEFGRRRQDRNKALDYTAGQLEQQGFTVPDDPSERRGFAQGFVENSALTGRSRRGMLGSMGAGEPGPRGEGGERSMQPATAPVAAGAEPVPKKDKPIVPEVDVTPGTPAGVQPAQTPPHRVSPPWWLATARAA